MKLYQYMINVHYDKEDNWSKYYTLDEKVVEVRETSKMYICEKGKDNHLINYGTRLNKDVINKIYDGVYSSLSPAKNEAIDAFVDNYNIKIEKLLAEVRHNNDMINMLVNLKEE